MNNNTSMEDFILKKIKQKEAEFKNSEIKNDSPMFHRLMGQIDILYEILSGHDNKYEEMKSIPPPDKDGALRFKRGVLAVSDPTLIKVLKAFSTSTKPRI